MTCGSALDDTTADAWRAPVWDGWPARPHFLDRSLRENVGFDPAADISKAFAQAQAAHVVASLPQGADTRAGRNRQAFGASAARDAGPRHPRRARSADRRRTHRADLDAATAAQVTDALLSSPPRAPRWIAATMTQVLAASHGPPDRDRGAS
ncbi:MAG: hypothetical protein R3D85_05255 [Paracoccaceae bacterium]